MLWYTAGLAQSPVQDAVENMYREGRKFYADGNYKRALQNFQEAIAVAKKDTDTSRESLLNLYQRAGNAYGKLRYQQNALAYLDTALTISLALYGEKHEEVAGVHMDRGVIYSQMLNLKASAASNEKALEIYKELYGPESARVGSVFMHMAIDYYKLHEYEASEFCYLRAKQIFDQALDPDDENHNRIYNNMGMLYRKKRDYKKALDYALTALEYKLKHYAPTHPSVGKYYSNIARVYLDIGEPEKAIPYNQQILEVLKATYGDAHPEYGGAVGELADIYNMLGDTRRAVTLYEQSHRIIANRLGPSHPYALASIANISRSLQAEGDIEGAIALTNRIISIMQQSDESYFPHLYRNAIRLAVLYKQGGRHDKARHIADSLLRVLHHRQEQPNALGFVSEYHHLRSLALKARADANVAQANGKDATLLHAAWADLSEIVDLIGTIRRDVSSDESQEYLYAESAEVYDLSVKTAIQLYRITEDVQYLVSALNVAEQSKAAILRRAMMSREALASDALPENMTAELRVMDEEIYRLRSRIRTAPEAEKDSLSQWSRQIVGLEDKKLLLMDRMKVEYPGYYRLKYREVNIDLSALQNSLSRENRACISFYISGDEGHLFYISGKQLRWWPFTWKPVYDQWIGTLNAQHVTSSARQFDVYTSNALYHTLWEQAETYLNADAVRRVTVIPHLSLNYLPFDLLARNAEPQDPHWLFEDFAISYAHALNVFMADLPRHTHAVSYAGFAPFNDYASVMAPYFAMRDALIPLPASTREVTRGSELFKGVAFVRERATYETFHQHAGHSGILHLATHAFVLPEAPLESGFYLYPDADGSEIAGSRQLTMFDIYNTAIPADLVLLSACQTGDGDLSAGEGPISLARAFSYAGSRSVVMSHWRANDASTAEIMLSFLQYLADGEPKDIALQNAKKTYLASADPLMAHPFFWAGISLYGDPGILTLKTRKSYWPISLAGFVLLVWGSAVLLRRRNSRVKQS